jgi:hypothetical protein
VIAYEMLGGVTPFTGEAREVLQAHQTETPPNLRPSRRRVPRALSQLVLQALDKEPARRPASALAFAQLLRARMEGVGALFRRAFTLYSEHFPIILKLSLLAHIPVFVTAVLTLGFHWAAEGWSKPAYALTGLGLGLLKVMATFVTSSTIAGVVAIIVTRLAVTPLQPIRLRSAFGVLRSRWRPFFTTGLMAVSAIVIGFVLLIIPGIIVMVRTALWAPVVLMERVRGREALRRTRQVAARSWGTVTIAVLFQFAVPLMVNEGVTRIFRTQTSEKSSMTHQLASEVTSLTSVLILPLLSIVVALVYLKLRQLGGEPLREVTPHITNAADARGDARRIP